MISKQTLLTDKTMKTEKNMKSLYINYGNAPDVLKSKLEALSPTSGYCVFIDISNSTALKDESLKKWILSIKNTFQNITGFLAPPCYPLKCLGDALMFFIPENDLIKVGTGYTALSFFDALQMIVSGEEKHCLPVKAGVVFSVNVYSISFFPEVDDIYGKDIDLASRLMNVAKSKQLVMNKAFYDKVKSEYDLIGNQQQFACVDEISECLEEIKGYPEKVTVYKFPKI